MCFGTATSCATEMQACCCHGSLSDAGGSAQHLDVHVGVLLLGLYYTECHAMAAATHEDAAAMMRH